MRRGLVFHLLPEVRVVPPNLWEEHHVLSQRAPMRGCTRVRLPCVSTSSWCACEANAEIISRAQLRWGTTFFQSRGEFECAAKFSLFGDLPRRLRTPALSSTSPSAAVGARAGSTRRILRSAARVLGRARE